MFCLGSTDYNLTLSMQEEQTAGSHYRWRARSADPKTAKLYEHIAHEEDIHYDEFKARRNELRGRKNTMKEHTLADLKKHIPAGGLLNPKLRVMKKQNVGKIQPFKMPKGVGNYSNVMKRG